MPTPCPAPGTDDLEQTITRRRVARAPRRVPEKLRKAPTATPSLLPVAWRPDALLIASSNAQVREVNLGAQTAPLDAAAVPAERRVKLADGTTASAGDVIIARRNDRCLAPSATDFVALDLTVPGEDAVITIEGQRPHTAVQALARVIERDDSAASATTARRQERDPVPLLRKACAGYLDALTVAGESVLGPAGVGAVAAQAELSVPGISDWSAWPALHARLERVTINGHMPGQVPRDEAMLVRYDHSRDLTAVLATARGPRPRQRTLGLACGGSSQLGDLARRPRGRRHRPAPDRAAHGGRQERLQQHRWTDAPATPGRCPRRPTPGSPNSGRHSIRASPPTRTGQPWPSSSTSPTARACASPTLAPHRHRAARSINPRPRWRTGSSTPSPITRPRQATRRQQRD